MFKYLKGLLKDTVIYSIGNILNKASGLILLPIYIEIIPIGEFGILTILELIILALIQICNFGLTSGFLRYFVKEKESGNLGSFIFSSLLTIIIFYIPVLIVGIYYSENLSFSLFETIKYSECVKIISLIILIEMIFGIMQQYYQNESKTITYTVFSVSSTLLTLLITLYLIKYQNWGIEAVLLGRLISKTLFTIISFFTFIRPILIFNYNYSLVKKSIRYGFPVVISSLGYIVYTMSDRFMINEFLDDDSLGKFGFGVRIASVINIVFIQAIGLGFLPEIFKNENNNHIYTKTYTYFVYSISTIVLIFLMTYQIPLNLYGSNSEYFDGLKIVPFLSLHYLALGSNYFLYSGISTSSKSKYIIYPTLITAIINIALNYFLIPRYGFIAAALATVISQFIYIFIANKIIQKINPIKFEWKRVTLSVSIGIGIYFIFLLTNSNVFISPLLITLYIYIIFNFNFLEKHEKEKIILTIVKQKKKYLNRTK